MKPSEDTFIVPGKTMPETWRAQGKNSSVRLESGRGRDPAWVGLPLRSVVSLPMRLPAMSADRRDAAVMLELEAAGIHAGESDFQVVTPPGEHRDQHAWTVVQSPQLPSHAISAPLDARFAPSVSFKTLRRGEARVWQESGHLAIALPDESGGVLHAQALSATAPDEDAAAELRCILAALDLNGLTPEVSTLTFEQSDEPLTPEALAPLAEGTGLPLATEPAPAPRPPQTEWRIVPPAIVQRRHDRRQQQTLMMGAAGVVVVILALLGAFAGRLWAREQSLKTRVAALNLVKPDLQVIHDAQQHWSLLEPALVPNKFVIEVFHQVAKLLPAEGVRLEIFSMKDGHIIMDGVASNPGLVGQLREDLTHAPAFSHLQWDIPSPTTLPDGTAKFHADGAPLVPAEGS